MVPRKIPTNHYPSVFSEDSVRRYCPRDVLRRYIVFSMNSGLVCPHRNIVGKSPCFLVVEKGNALPPRKASVIARVGSDSHVLTVDLSTVDSPVRVLGFPVMTVEEMSDATWAPFSNTEFNRTIISRGLNLTDVICFPISSGWYGNKEETSRLIKIQCYLTRGTANFYMQPIEGLTLLYDLDTKQILEVSDTGRAILIPSPNNTDRLPFRQFSDPG
ncbi:hypothetical protein YC2023_023994 [Brassica napus]